MILSRNFLFTSGSQMQSRSRQRNQWTPFGELMDIHTTICDFCTWVGYYTADTPYSLSALVISQRDHCCLPGIPLLFFTQQSFRVFHCLKWALTYPSFGEIIFFFFLSTVLEHMDRWTKKILWRRRGSRSLKRCTFPSPKYYLYSYNNQVLKSSRRRNLQVM